VWLIRVFSFLKVGNYASNKNTTIASNIRGKRREHTKEIVLLPLVMSASRGLAKEAADYYKVLASKLASPWDQPYYQTMNWLKCTITLPFYVHLYCTFEEPTPARVMHSGAHQWI